MFLHNFKYTLKTLFRNKSLLFWTFAFPILMATFFHMAFADIIESEQLNVINIAIIDNDEFNNNMIYKEAFKSLSDKNNPERLFDITYTNKDEASILLEDDKIEGYLELVKEKPKLTFKSNGINQTILKYVIDEIHDTEKIMLSANLNKALESNIELKNKANSNLDYMMIEFYTLIAMTCLYAGSIGMIAIGRSLPYLKGNGKRITVSPAKRSSVIFSSLIASYIIQLMVIGLLFAYTIGVLNVDYSDKIGYIILLTLVGSLAGISIGIFIGSYFKSSENAKTGILIAITMTGCFLAGMMGVMMKYIIDKNLPIVNKVNPANMITDGFYSLYYYSDYARYFFNLVSLLIFSLILLVLSCNKIRRARYDSI